MGKSRGVKVTVVVGSDQGKWLGVVRVKKADVIKVRRREGQSGR